MQQLVCEACGSYDLVKNGDVYECQHCGMVYTPEEAKKVEIDAKISIDNSKRLNELYSAARRARQMGSYTLAKQYYNEILSLDADSWEAALYTVSCGAKDIRLFQVNSTWSNFKQSFSTIQALISAQYLAKKMTLNELLSAESEVTTEILSFTESVYSTYQNKIKELWPDCSDMWAEHQKRMYLVASDLFSMGNQIAEGLKLVVKIDEKTSYKAAIPLWKWAVSMLDRHCRYLAGLPIKTYDMRGSYVKLAKKFTPYIKKGDSTYTEPEYIAKHGINSSSSGTGSSSGGCYVATAVYGSYDCPEVWTLRRFRDFTLAETWYGRAFIRTYYAISPTLVKWFGHTAWFKKLWRGKLDRLVEKLNSNGVENTEYADRNW